MSTDPDQIRAEIERTRGELSSDVDALADKVSPSNIAHRQVDKVRDVAGSVRERVMGSPSATGNGASGTSMRDATSAVADNASAATTALRREAQGNPLAAGLIAFGAGLLVASLLPATAREQDLARTVKEKAAPLTEDLTGAAKQAAHNLAEPAQQAAQSVKVAATEAARSVQQESTDTAHEVKDDATSAAQHVRTQQD